jgi:predicted metalloprotease with PDZ domain
MLMLRAAVRAAVCLLVLAASAGAQAPVAYRLSFPDYVRHWMDVEIVFADVAADPVEIHMPRTSPGRYARHEFVKNVFDVQIRDGANRPLTAEQPALHVWRVRGHAGTVRVRYRVFGDRVDGTYFRVDATQAHINIPATLMWAKTLEDRPATITLVPPPDVAWTAATQLYATADPLVFTAPNLAYLMDSPVQLTTQTMRSFEVPPLPGTAAKPATIRLALKHDGADADVDALAGAARRIVREAQAIFGELPAFEPGHYTFLANYGRDVAPDGMEHRNSTVVTYPGSIADTDRLLDGVAHEFFHVWNVERIRPKSLEPFDLDEAAVATELWMAEGFTQYYQLLLKGRAGLVSEQETLAGFAALVNAVNVSAGRRVRFAPEMSRLAPLVDQACSIDPTNWGNTYLSYYTFGGAIALGLDLELRDRTDGRLTLDDYMRALWTTFGKAPGPPGTVAKPYTPADLEATLAAVSGSRSFAGEFFERYVNGPELVEYGMLLRRMGLVWRLAHPGRPWIGDLPVVGAQGGAYVTEAAPMGTPAYDAGFGRGDVIVSMGGADVTGPQDLARIVAAAKPGNRLEVTFLRHGKAHQATIAVRQEPTRELVTREAAGETPTDEERKMRAGWLSSRAPQP